MQQNQVLSLKIYILWTYVLRTVIDRDDGMLSRRLAENRCGNF
jgi:hypothetical protein